MLILSHILDWSVIKLKLVACVVFCIFKWGIVLWFICYIIFILLVCSFVLFFVCLFFLSGRSKYCTQTGLVIARMDHYCVWLGNSVGFRNHRIFVLFLITQLAATTMYSAMLIRWYNNNCLFYVDFFIYFLFTGNVIVESVKSICVLFVSTIITNFLFVLFFVFSNFF